MDFGHLNVMQNWHKDLDDFQSWQGEIELAILCDQIGFDALSCVEHHFQAYGMCGDNLQYLSYLAGVTKNAKLMPGAIILPWNNPLRIVEKLAMLEYVAPGRVVPGFGRGLSKKEYDGFSIDMNTARGRFDEAAKMILDGLENGYVEGDGPYYPQPRTDIRPKPIKGYRDQLFCVAMSPDSADAAAALGGRMMTFIQYPIEHHVPMIEGWRTKFRECHPSVPVPEPILTDVTLCHEDPDAAKEMAYKYLKNHFMAVMDHYDF
ncbi:MAG: LLM class flavin-dependent oxidoreductase, partial [Sporichthyaceae bacterium]